MLWIQVYSTLPSHKKVYLLAEKLKITRFAAVGLMVSLWAWVATNCPDGEISNYPHKAVAEACGWTKSAETLWKGLVDCALLDVDGDVVDVHNWDKHELLLMDSLDRNKKQSAERMKRYRERKKRVEKPAKVAVTDGDALRNGYATEPQCYAPTVPIPIPIPIPNHRETTTDLVVPQEKTTFGPPTQDEVMAFCRERKSAVNPVRFWSHYAATGWEVGGAPIKDWKAMLVKWEASEGERFDKSRPGSGRDTGHGIRNKQIWGSAGEGELADIELQALADLRMEYYANNGGAEGIALAGSDDTGSARSFVSCRAGGGIGGE